MNVYDFDETIFHPDSSYGFFLYCLRHYPRAVLKALPRSAAEGIRYALLPLRHGKKDAKRLKEALFSYLNRLGDVHGTVSAFWDENADGFAPWYLQQKRTDDLIISASPAFLLEPAAGKLGVRLIATDMNPFTGKIRGRNCHDEEKARRFREAYPDERVEEFYSDSLSDTPMAKLAERAYLVKGGERIPWPYL